MLYSGSSKTTCKLIYNIIWIQKTISTTQSSLFYFLCAMFDKNYGNWGSGMI